MLKDRLKDSAIRHAKPGEKPTKLADGGGLRADRGGAGGASNTATRARRSS
jgi:hypothetical protein